MSAVNPGLSVVVIGRNEGERLRRCLESIRAMDYAGGWELLYVDSGSSDDSVAIAESLGARVLRLGFGPHTAARARNAGWRAAAGSWILFLDGDTLLHADFPRLALKAGAETSVAAVWGHRRELRPFTNFYHRVLDLDWVYAPGYTEFCGGDALIRRSAVEQVGGFDESLIAGEEPELCTRLRESGFRILHIDAPMTGHDLAISRWGQYWKRASRAGYAYAQMAWRTRGNVVRLWGNESRGNCLRAIALLLLVGLAPFAPLAVSFVLATLILRSAWRARWKSSSALSLVCYGTHSHLQQLPIFAGQLAFWWDVARNRHRGLIEYK